MSIACFICGRGPPNGPAVYRINPRGQLGIWSCEKHLPPDTQIDPEVREIIDILKNDKH